MNHLNTNSTTPNNFCTTQTKHLFHVIKSTIYGGKNNLRTTRNNKTTVQQLINTNNLYK